MPALTSRRSGALAGVLWLAAAVIYVATEAIAATRFPGYSYATNYISDLGVAEVGPYSGRDIDSPLHAVMNVGFVAHGILFLVAAILLIRTVTAGPRRTFVLLAAVHGVGIVLVGLFHGSQAATDNGTVTVHVLGAAMAIVGGNAAAITAGVGSRRLGMPRRYTVFSLVDSNSADISLLTDGIWERASVYAITVWEVTTGVLLLVNAGRARR